MKTPKSGSVHVERIVPGTVPWQMGYADHIQRYEFAARWLQPGSKVLDAGCGCGYGAAYLADHGAGLVVAVDIAAEALDIGRRQFHREQIVWVREDCQSLRTVESYAPFDGICCLENLEHLPRPESFLGRIRHLLRPEGVFVTSTPNRLLLNKLRAVPPETPSCNPYHCKEYTAQEFTALLDEYFEQVLLTHQRHSPATRIQLSLEPALRALWSNPALRVGRWLQRVVRRREVSERIEQLLPAYEWEILDADPGDEMTWTFLALCRRPKQIS